MNKYNKIVKIITVLTKDLELNQIPNGLEDHVYKSLNKLNLLELSELNLLLDLQKIKHLNK